MEYILIVPIFVLVVLLLYKYRKDRLEYYNSLGARVVGHRYFIEPVARLSYENMDITLLTEGPKGFYSLIIQVPVATLGYMKLRESDFFDKALFQRKYKNLALECEDEAWVNRLFGLAGFEELVDRLFEGFRISWFEIKGNLLRIGWYIRKGPSEVEKERLFGSLDVLKDLLNLLNGVTPAENYRGDLRDWLTFKLPIALTILLIIVGIVGGFYKYQPVCLLNMLFTGFKLLFPFALFYLALCLFMVGGATMGQRVFLKTSLVLFTCSFFITLFFLPYINGRFDNSMVEVKRDLVKRKYVSVKRGPTLILAELHKNNPWCEGFKVSKNFYNRVQVGSLVEYETKRGFLGVEWLYSGLVLVE
ncbi:MAG: hypothetical protein ACK4VK_07770 [Aquificaceae bacterium]